jgi:hypothetical protein
MRTNAVSRNWMAALAGAGLLLAAAPAMAATVCIDTRQIDSQKVEGHGSSILFKMKDGGSWRNTLQAPCPDLDFEGFSWVVRNPDNTVCENMQSMRVLRSGQICMLGKFTRVDSPKQSR